MKRINYALLAFATFVAIFTLAGCGDNKQVAEVKALAFSYPNRFAQDPNLTVDQALDTRNVCDSVKWVVKQTDRNQTFVEYTCDYKGVADSGFIERDKSDVASAGDVYQWTYGTDGEPELSYVGVVLHYKNGTSKDFKYDATSIMRVAADNKAANFDDAWSVLRGQPIPIKPALPFTDTTYGNTLTALYPGQSAMKAAAYAYMWKGAPTSFYIFGIDALGYPAVEDSAEAKALVFPVNPADVQIATKVDPSSISTFGANPPSQLQSNKLFCLNEMCYDNTGKLVGRAPASVLAQESASNGSAQTAAVAPATDPTTPTGSSDDWPAMTPCIQKLDNAFVKDAQAKGIDSSVNIEQMQEWAATCKALGQ